MGYCIVALLIALVISGFVSGWIFDVLGFASGAQEVAAPKDSGDGGWSFWSVLLVFVLLPGVIGIATDWRGQGASGWLLLVGVGISLFLGAIYLVLLAIWSFFSLVF